MTQGQIIETERVKRQMGQQELGDLLGLTRISVSNIEKGKTHLTKKKVAMVSEIFGISADELINGNDAEYVDPRRTASGVLHSRLRATKKYCDEHYDYYKLRFQAGEKADLQEIAKEMGYASFNQFCVDAIKEKAGV